MYAYVDESGNTGTNLFDPEQPTFFTAALITKINFDLLYKKDVKRIASTIGEEVLHANSLGVEKVEEISEQLLILLKKCSVRFFVSDVEKKYLVTTKLFDTLFDSFENKAVPWHMYNLRSMRLLLVFKIASILTEDTAKKFWSSILEKEKTKAYNIFLESITEIKQNITMLHDQRSRQIITDAIEWATQNHESIHLHTNSKAARLGHLPNLAAFPNLLEGIEKQSQFWNRKVIEIVHDRQSQFQGALQHWHYLYTNAAPDIITWPLGEQHIIRRVPGSKFRISSSKESPGIQITDTLLWLFKRAIDGKPLDNNTARLMNYVRKNARHSPLSFNAAENWLRVFFTDLYDKPFTAEHQHSAEEYLRFSEKNRQNRMLKYAKQKKNSKDKLYPRRPRDNRP